MKKERDAAAYRVYVTDVLRAIGKNAAIMAKQAGGEGKYISARYYDMINPKPADNRSAEEIIEHIRAGLRGDK